MPKVSSIDRRTLTFLALFLLVLFSLLVIQFFRLQVLEHKMWAKKALEQHTTIVKKPFKRGVFYSNTALQKGHPPSKVPFVIDVAKFHLYADPIRIEAQVKEGICKYLGQEFDLDTSGYAHLCAQFQKRCYSRKIARWCDMEQKERIDTWWRSYRKEHKIPANALYFTKDFKRSYPFGKLLGQVLHTVRDLRDEATFEQIPTGGLELAFNSHLQGKMGKELLYRSPRHRMDGGKIIEVAQDGADVYLTINHSLQAIAEKEIQVQVKKTGAKRGWAILMDPKNGHILALAQYPFFYPEHYRHYFNDKEWEEQTHVKALTHPYEPGSTMKAITGAIVLMANQELVGRGEEPLFNLVEMIDTRPRPFPGRRKPIRDIRTHHYLNFHMAIQKSSNVYMAALVERIIERLGPAWYRNVLSEVFGFGKRGGIELLGESPGLLPRPGVLHPNGTLEWSKPTPYSLAMGYNLLVNSFQMLRAFAIIANEGYDVKPTLVKKIVRPLEGGGEEVIFDAAKEVLKKQRLIDPTICRQVVYAMKYVTKKGGAAWRGDINGFTEAGKTSTTEKLIGGAYSKKIHFSTFLGFAPAINPRFILLVAIDEPSWAYRYGSLCAAPCFKRIGLQALQFLGDEPDDPFGYPVGDPRRDAKKKDWALEVEALADLYKAWN